MSNDAGYPVTHDNQPLLTPAKNPLVAPTRAMAEALAAVSSASMLRQLAYTAIDRISAQRGAMVEALLAYVDTETLAYRGEELAARAGGWDAVLASFKARYGISWEVSVGVMPANQPESLHRVVRERLSKCDAWQLAAAGILASVYSSIALTVAVLDGALDAHEALTLSRLEEDIQAERWGHDEEADARLTRLTDEIVNVKRFLGLLAAV